MSDIYRDSIFWVEVDRISPNPFQPRREFDQAKLQELADSIRMYGLLQPLTVTRREIQRADGGLTVEYELIAGERRLRASKLAGIQQVPVIIRSGEDDDRVKLELAIIENLQREDLNPVDRAQAFHKLYKDFGFTHVEIGKKMGKSREYVSNTLRLLTLPDDILQHLAEGRLVEGHTRPLLMLAHKPEEQAVLMKEILLKKLTVRESESIARRVAQDRVTAKHKIDPDILQVERVLTEKFGTRVTIEPREVGGRLVISFFSAQDLQALLDSMRVDDERAVVPNVFANAEQSVASTGDLQAEVLVTESASDIEEYEQIDEAVDDVPPADRAMVESLGYARPMEEAGVERKPESEGIFDSFLRSIRGATGESPAPEVAPVVSASEVASMEHATVVPDADRPLPERSAPVASRAEEKREDDTDLYSVRNFSI